MTIDPPSMRPPTDGPTGETTFARFPGAAVVQVVHGQPDDPDSMVVELQPAEVTVTNRRVVADVGDDVWAWHLDDLEAIVHASNGTWSIMVVPDIPDFGVTVPADRVAEFRGLFDGMHRVHVRHQRAAIAAPVSMPEAGWPSAVQFAPPPPTLIAPITVTNEPGSLPLTDELVFGAPPPPNGAFVVQPDLGFDTVLRDAPPRGRWRRRPSARRQAAVAVVHKRCRWQTSHRRTRRSPASTPATSRRGSALGWCSTVSSAMEPGRVTALIGPSRCGKSTFLRILNRMHEMIPGAQMEAAGPRRRTRHLRPGTQAHRRTSGGEHGVSETNPFPAMSIYDNVLAGFRLASVKASPSLKDEIVESCLTKAGLWNEVKDRLRQQVAA
ncbi:MAG: ATP-binding cassette domain-containing protein [Ilumatobacteraceae bacterium]